jgi:hypothetical protein
VGNVVEVGDEEEAEEILPCVFGCSIMPVMFLMSQTVGQENYISPILAYSIPGKPVGWPFWPAAHLLVRSVVSLQGVAGNKKP